MKCLDIDSPEAIFFNVFSSSSSLSSNWSKSKGNFLLAMMYAICFCARLSSQEVKTSVTSLGSLSFKAMRRAFGYSLYFKYKLHATFKYKTLSSFVAAKLANDCKYKHVRGKEGSSQMLSIVPAQSTSQSRSMASTSALCFILKGTISSTKSMSSLVSAPFSSLSLNSAAMSPEMFLMYSWPQLVSPSLVPSSRYFRLVRDPSFWKVVDRIERMSAKKRFKSPDAIFS
mmetsp:Transcript_101002/g.308869  ORF Transcript_101002/g.308869 Transcript_101002/m.308869 type:complete len:228 (+) Transcript_101002:1697-2380(+)